MSDSTNDFDLKLHSGRSMILAAFMGGPLALGIMMGENERTLGDEAKGKKFQLIGFLTGIACVLAFQFIPAVSAAFHELPQVAFPAFFAVLGMALVYRFQREEIKACQQKGAFKSRWFAALYAFLSWIFYLFLYFSINYLM